MQFIVASWSSESADGLLCTLITSIDGIYVNYSYASESCSYAFTTTVTLIMSVTLNGPPLSNLFPYIFAAILDKFLFMFP